MAQAGPQDNGIIQQGDGSGNGISSEDESNVEEERDDQGPGEQHGEGSGGSVDSDWFEVSKHFIELILDGLIIGFWDIMFIILHKRHL